MFKNISGTANAMMNLQFMAMVGVYFVKKLGFANSISQGGVSIGGLVLAPLLTYLFEEYGYTGTYIFMAGFHLNVAIAGALLRPLSFYDRSKKKSVEKKPLLQEPKESTEAKNTDGGVPQKQTNGFQHVAMATDKTIGIEMSGSNGDVTYRRRCFSEHKPEVNGQEARNELSASLKSLFDLDSPRFATSDINSSIVDLTISKLTVRKSDDSFQDETKRTVCQTLLRLLSRLFDRKLLSKPEFLYYLLATFFLCAGSTSATAFVPQHCIDLGIDKQTVAWIVGGISILELISRVLLGVIADRNWCHRSTLMAGAALGIGIVAQLSHFMTSLGTIIAYSAVAGFLQGVYWSLFAVVILDILSVKELKVVLLRNVIKIYIPFVH